ncbi:unnamed protein product [marine sediment metagenome]|uniref:Uncharacterized protein n=1 Tax=marine sediment metagenome TaxID=412755 RepID=X1J0M9_9ZZZZ
MTPVDFLKCILSNLTILVGTKSVKGISIKDMVKSFTPAWLRNKLKSKVLEIKKPVLDFNTLAFRSYLICKMNKLLNEDIKKS